MKVSDNVQLLDMAAHDYTQGQGLALLEQLIQNGAIVSGSVNEALEEVRKYRENAMISIDTR